MKSKFYSPAIVTRDFDVNYCVGKLISTRVSWASNCESTVCQNG